MSDDQSKDTNIYFKDCLDSENKKRKTEVEPDANGEWRCPPPCRSLPFASIQSLRRHARGHVRLTPWPDDKDPIEVSEPSSGAASPQPAGRSNRPPDLARIMSPPGATAGAPRRSPPPFRSSSALGRPALLPDFASPSPSAPPQLQKISPYAKDFARAPSPASKGFATLPGNDTGRSKTVSANKVPCAKSHTPASVPDAFNSQTPHHTVPVTAIQKKSATLPRPRILAPEESSDDNEQVRLPRTRPRAAKSPRQVRAQQVTAGTRDAGQSDATNTLNSAASAPEDSADSDAGSVSTKYSATLNFEFNDWNGFSQALDDIEDIYETAEEQRKRLEGRLHTSPAPPPPSRAQSPVAASGRPKSDVDVSSTHSEPGEAASKLEPPEPQPPSPSDLLVDNSLLAYGVVINVKHRLIICTECQDAFLPDAIANHLVDMHKLARMPVALIKRLKDQHRLYTDAAAVVRDLRDSPRAPIEGISIQTNGYHCQRCYSARATLDSIRQHYKRAHHDHRHEYKDAPQGDFQELHMSSQFRRLIPVSRALANLEERDFYSTWYHSVDHNALPKFKPTTNARETPTWLLILGWKDYVKDLDVDAVRPLVKPRKPDERYAWVQPALVTYLRNVKCKLHEFNPQILGWLSSIDGVYTPQFFKAPQQDETLVEYARPTAALIVLSLNCILFPTDDFPLPLNDSQRAALQKLAGTYVQSGEDCNHDDVQEALDAVLVSLYLYTLDGSGTRFQEPLQCVNVLLSLSGDGGFKRPRKLTQKYAAEVWVIRAVAAMQMYRDKDKPEYTFFTACEKWRVFLFQGQPTPMGNLRSEWVTISGAAQEELEIPRVLYLDRACQHFTFDGVRSSVEECGKMVRGVYQECNDLIRELTFGFSCESFGFDIRNIQDNLASTKAGYSWLTDDRNGYRSIPGLLFRKLADSTDPAHHNFFATVLPNNKMAWNAVNCHWFMKTAQSLLRSILGASHLSHGQMSRGTELMTVTLVNLPDDLRSFMMHAGQAVFVLNSSKTDSVSRRSRLTPHFQTEEMTRILVIYVGVIRQIEKELAKVLYDKETAELYTTHLFVGPGGRWTPDMMSGELQRITGKYLGVHMTLGIRDLRQLLIAIYYRHCHSFIAFEDLKDDDARAHDEKGNRSSGHTGEIARDFYGVEYL